MTTNTTDSNAVTYDSTIDPETIVPNAQLLDLTTVMYDDSKDGVTDLEAAVPMIARIDWNGYRALPWESKAHGKPFASINLDRFRSYLEQNTSGSVGRPRRDSYNTLCKAIGDVQANNVIGIHIKIPSEVFAKLYDMVDAHNMRKSEARARNTFLLDDIYAMILAKVEEAKVEEAKVAKDTPKAKVAKDTAKAK